MYTNVRLVYKENTHMFLHVNKYLFVSQKKPLIMKM